MHFPGGQVCAFLTRINTRGIAVKTMPAARSGKRRTFGAGRNGCNDRLGTNIVVLAFLVIVAVFLPSYALSQQTPSPTEVPLEADQRPDESASPDSESPIPSHDWHGRIELKRQNTERGTTDESTKTTLRIESFFKGPIRLLRVDLQFPDEKTSFEGQPFNPRLGDIKVRVGFQPLKASDFSFPSFIEVTLPTADPDSLGSGKYQLSAGLRMLTPVSLPLVDHASHTSVFEAEMQQVNSIGGDPSRNDINYTKFEFTLYDIWCKKYTLKLKLKPTVDWMKDETGAVFEVEGGLLFARNWRTWLMVGRRISGPSGVSNTYGKRLEIGVARTF